MIIEVTAPQIGISLGSLAGVGVLVVAILRYTEGKRKGIYGTIDKERDASSKKYMSKELCEERSKNIQKTLDGVAGDMKKLLGKNGIS